MAVLLSSLSSVTLCGCACMGGGQVTAHPALPPVMPWPSCTSQRVAGFLGGSACSLFCPCSCPRSLPFHRTELLFYNGHPRYHYHHRFIRCLSVCLSLWLSSNNPCPCSLVIPAWHPPCCATNHHVHPVGSAHVAP